MATTTTTIDGNNSNNNNNNNNQDTSVWAISEDCVRCGRQYVDYIRDPDMSVCDVCLEQELFGDGEPVSSSAVVDSSTSNTREEGIVWEDVNLIIACEGCGREYDCIDDAHESLCHACQAPPGGNEPTSISTAVDTTTAATTVAPADPRLKSRGKGEISCRKCRGPFRPSKNNNGVHCTRCCNVKAKKGFDWWAEQGLEAPAKAKRDIADFHQKKALRLDH
jgi:hypothetical protein